MSFADNLKTARKAQGISQEDLAEAMDLSRQAVSKWEQGDGFPEADKLDELAAELDVSLDYLMRGKIETEGLQNQHGTGLPRITVMPQDGRAIASCYKFLAFPVSQKPDEPKFALYGVDTQTHRDEHRVFLGWYADNDTIQKEMDALFAAISGGKPSYELQYTVPVKSQFWNIKLA